MNTTSHSPFDRYLLLQFKSGLRERQRELQQIIEKAEQEIRALANLGPLDAVDVSCGNSSKESMFDYSIQNRSQLRLVELALERIRSGNFGTCAACEGSIGLKRLQAVPWASHCIRCQQRFEYGGIDESGMSFSSHPG